MPKTINSSLLAYIAGPVVTIAVLVLITRVDGTIMGFTSWDTTINYSGVDYVPAISMSPSTIKSTSTGTTDQMDIIGAIDSVLITDTDIYAGRYDNASVRVMRINPYQTGWGVIVDLVGTLGTVDYGDGRFQVAINAMSNQLSMMIGDIISPTCRVKQLGDSQCKVTIASYRFAKTVVSVSGGNRVLTFSDAHATGYFDYGMVRFNSYGTGGGLNYLINMEIKTSTQAAGVTTITLQEPMPYTVSPGDSVVLEAGCDRNATTCRAKFSNLVNFHAEPYVPGNDYLIRTARQPGT